MEIHVEVPGASPLLPREIFDGQAAPGTEVEGPPGVTVRMERMVERRAVGAESILEFVLTFGQDVGAGVLGAWLYDKFSGETSVIRIGEREVPVEKDALEGVIREELEADD